MRAPFRVGDRLEVLPQEIGNRGEALARVEGWRVRIPLGLPGERARIRIEHVSKGGPVATAVYEGAAASPHPARRRPPCAIHEACGGCGLQMASEDTALELKVREAQRHMHDAGIRIGEWRDAHPSPRAFGYRSKTFLLPQFRRRRLLLGARPPRGENLVDTSGCGVLRPEVEALARTAREVLGERAERGFLPLARDPERPGLRTLLLRCSAAGETQLTLVHRGPDGGGRWTKIVREIASRGDAAAAFLQRHDASGGRVQSDEPEHQVHGAGPLEEHLVAPDLFVRIPPTAFVQANPEVAAHLYARAATELGSGFLGEAYCGAGVVGLWALRLDPQSRLTAVDRSPRAIEAARRNAARNGLQKRVRFDTGPAEQVLSAWDRADRKLDALFVNPPRTGLAPDARETLSRSSACRLVYLSCSPRSLARDAAALCAGGWRLGWVEPADMLPQTPHLELLARFDR